MKFTYLFLILFFSYHLSLYGQYHVGTSFILSDITTNNISILGQYDLNTKHQIGIGLKYHFNDDSTKPLFRFYYRNLYAEKFINRFGFTFEYKYWFLNNKYIKPYLFYNIQYIKIGSKFFNNLTGTDLMTGLQIKNNQQDTYDPIHFFENHIGLGMDIILNKKMSIFAGFSGGITLLRGLYGIDDLNAGRTKYAFAKNKLNEFSWLFNTGISYSINKKKTNKKDYSKKRK